MKRILVQLERLENHYNKALATYELSYLLDLSHILRVWTELVDALPGYYPDFSNKKKFKSAGPTKKLTRLISKDQYVLSYLPCGVTTNVNASEMVSVPDEFGEEGQIGISVNRSGPPNNYNKFSFIDKSVNHYATTFIGVENLFLRILDKQKTDRYTFKSWMQTEIVRIAYKKDNKLDRKIINRETLIKRAANILDASHSSLSADEGSNIYDDAVKTLLKFKCGGLPLVYFLLLSIAQDILNNTSLYIVKKPNKAPQPTPKSGAAGL